MLLIILLLFCAAQERQATERYGLSEHFFSARHLHICEITMLRKSHQQYDILLAAFNN
jgi:hypothetical protein